VTSIAVIIGRCIAGCLGAILIYSALFLYKEEEGGLENRIEQWWQKIRDLHAHAISRETAFLKVVADITSKGFAKLFGERLFGPKAVAASVCYSQAAICLVATITLSLYSGYSELPTRQAVELYFTFGTPCLFFLFLGSLGAFVNRQRQKQFWLSSVLIATAIWPPICFIVYHRVLSLEVSALSEWSMNGYGIQIATLLVATGCDFLFIVLTRVMLARAAASNSFIEIAALAIGNACLAALLFIAPLVISLRAPPPDPSYSRFQRVILNGANFVIQLVGASNFLDALVSLTWFILAIMMLLHRLLWPLIERPVYALFRYRVFSEQKKLTFFSGVALVGLAVPRVGHALENLVKAIRG
jgi:hypothetical protein